DCKCCINLFVTSTDRIFLFLIIEASVVASISNIALISINRTIWLIVKPPVTQNKQKWQGARTISSKQPLTYALLAFILLPLSFSGRYDFFLFIYKVFAVCFLNYLLIFRFINLQS